jgi:uncharacterized membrane protein
MLSRAIGQYGLNGWPIWGGAALAFYIVGLSYVARRESFRGPVPFWPLIFLLVPVGLAMLINPDHWRKPATWMSVVLVVWIIRCVRMVFFAGEINVPRIVSGLLAGIVLVDWLAVAPQCSIVLDVIFALLFAATLASQRFIPGT